MFTTIIVQPIFNLLVLIYALIPGHNFGLAVILFTIIIRLLLWPLVKKQLHQTKVMRKLQPELKRVKKAAAGNRQKEAALQMELYKEHGVNPVGTLPILIVQFIVLIGLYSGLRRVISDPHNLVSFAYPALQNLPWMQHLASNIHAFDDTLFGIVNLSRSAIGKAGGIYWPAMVLVVASALTQYFQAKQLMPSSKDSKGLREILRSSSSGKSADQAEVNAAVGRSTRFLLPGLIFLFTVNIASALSLYWFVGGLVAYIQQSIVLKEDETEMDILADKPTRDIAEIPEAEIVASPAQNQPKSKKSSKRHKRRKR